MFSIQKSSFELNDVSEFRWHFPSAFSPEAHAEWGLCKILEYIGLHEIRRRVLQCLSYKFPCALQLKQWGILNQVKCRLFEKCYKEKKVRQPPDSVESVGHVQCYLLPCPLPPGAGQNRAKLRKDIEEYYIAYGIDFDETDIDTFIARRPDGTAFDKEKKLCVLLEYTRAVDTNEDWAEKKEQEKNNRYSSFLGFINHLSNREKSGWKASQTNFTTGVRGSLHTNQFLTRLEITRGKKQEHARSHTQ